MHQADARRGNESETTLSTHRRFDLGQDDARDEAIDKSHEAGDDDPAHAPTNDELALSLDPQSRHADVMHTADRSSIDESRSEVDGCEASSYPSNEVVEVRFGFVPIASFYSCSSGGGEKVI